jgi:hypothetical protein
MIFPPAIARAVLRGDVTQARRPHQDRDPYYRQTTRPKTNGRSRTLVKPYRPTTGDRVPVQQRVTRNGRQTVETCGHIILTSVRIAPAGDLTFTDARQMGYRTTTDAMAAWMIDHDSDWTVDPDTLGTCQACGGPGIHTDGYCVTCGCDDQPHARFTAKHANRPVWVLQFQLDTQHVPRLLAASPSTESDYVTSPALALPDEPEALTTDDHARHVQRNASMTHAQWRALEHATRDAELEQLSLGRRLDRAIAEAAAEGRSISRDVNVIEKRLRALEQSRHR